MTESEPRAAQRARAVLEGAGHEVLSCTDSRGGPFPCRGVAGDSCPLDEGASVAVSAPGCVPPEPQAGDVGLICALRRHLPVLVAAPQDVAWPGSRPNHVAIGDLVSAVEQAASAVLPRHTEAVLDEARRLAGVTARAAVTRSTDGLEVVIDLPDGFDERVARSIAVRAQGVIRRIDPWAARIDVRLGAV